MNIPAGKVLYKVYGWDAPPGMISHAGTEAKEHYIGDIVLKDAMHTSKYGDESMFFKHGSTERDVREIPAWESKYKKFGW